MAFDRPDSPDSPGSRRRSLSTLAVLTVLGALTLSACTSDTEPPLPTATSPAASGAPTSAPEVALVSDGTASDNKPFFDQINSRTATNSEAGGRDFVDALVASGFDKAAMEVTKDATTLGDRAESIQFSVRWQDQCLIGQFGPAVGGYHSTLQPVLGTGLCLIGETRPIDW